MRRRRLESVRQQTYFPEWMIEEICAEARRQERSISWLVKKAWEIAKPKIARYPKAPA